MNAYHLSGKACIALVALLIFGMAGCGGQKAAPPPPPGTSAAVNIPPQAQAAIQQARQGQRQSGQAAFAAKK